MTARRLGLFGGTFNPVHEGHLQIARDAKRAAELDEVMFIPCATPPHKTPTWLASGEDRLNMLTLALENEPAFTVNDLELDREGPSYSIDTVRAIRAAHPEDALTFIIGSDSLVELHLWKDIEALHPKQFLSQSRKCGVFKRHTLGIVIHIGNQCRNGL